MVRWTVPARDDLRSIYDYIAQDSRHYARKVVDDIREKVGVVAALPRVGRKIPELNEDLVREVSVYSYRVIYEIADDATYVLAVVHKRRDVRAEDVVR